MVDSTFLVSTLIKFSFCVLFCLRLALDNLSFALLSDFLRSAAFLTAASVPFFADVAVVEAALYADVASAIGFYILVDVCERGRE